MVVVVVVVLVVGEGGRVFEGGGSTGAFVWEGEDGVGEAVDEFVVGAKVDAGGEGVRLGGVVGGVRFIFLPGGRTRSGWWCLQLLFHILLFFAFSLEAFARRDGDSLGAVVVLLPGIPEVFRGRYGGVGGQRCVLVCWRDGAALLGVGAKIPGVGAASLDLHFGEGSLCAPLFDGAREVW